jgi:hypothetical protein
MKMGNEREEWRPVTEPDFADLYMVSSLGRVARILRGTTCRKTGYRTIILARRGVAYKSYRVHQLVARAFVGPQPEGTVVNHIDEDKANTLPGNLEFLTQGDNVRHSIRSGRRKIVKNAATGQFAPILTVDQVGEIKTMVREGCPVDLLAKEYGVSTQSIVHIKTGKNWNRVPAKL